MRTLVRNGTVYLEDRTTVTDVLVDNGLFADIGKIDYAIDGCEVIDATGLHVLPGLIDIHTHLDDTIGKYRLADTWASGSEIALRNGITTLCGFITQRPGASLAAAVDAALSMADGHSHCDYAFHLTPVSFEKGDWAYVERLLSDGFRTFKLYTTYREAGLFLDYRNLRGAMERIREMGMPVLVHCEDDALLSRAKALTAGTVTPYGHALSRPMEAEIEAVKRVMEIAVKTKCRTHVVHVSTAEGARLIAQARPDLAVTCETCPQYLFLNEDKYKETDGHSYICSPPLRSEKNRAEMWKLTHEETFDAYVTDHCAFSKSDKDADRSDYSKVPKGLPGIGALVPLMHELHNEPAVLARRLALNPAKIAGLYPRKGSIRKGADADLVIMGTQGAEREIRTSLSVVYEPYQGKTTGLEVRRVLLRGETIVEDGLLIEGKRFAGKRA
jgi:dihydropyrimidinase